MPKITGLKQLLAKKYTFLEDLPAVISESFGALVENFIMIIWGQSGNGKSNFIMQFLAVIMKYGNVLYVALEEGTESTMQMMAIRHLNDDHSGKIQWAESDMVYDELVKKLAKKKSAKFVVIDSVQYWDLDYERYKRLKERFKNKTFIFISHASGKSPDGKTADKIRYDAGIKVRVEGNVAFPISRYGGNKPYLIYEPGAKKYWGEKYKSVMKGIPDKKAPRKKAAKKEAEPKEVLQANDEFIID